MKIKDGLFLCTVGDSSVVLANGQSDMQIHGLTTLNATGAFIWNRIEQHDDEAAVIEALMREFDVDRATAEADVRAFIAMLRKADFIED